MRKAEVYMHDLLAGILEETESGFEFTYEPHYLERTEAEALSLTLPLREEPYRYRMLFPCFDGLIPEGWLLEIAENNWKIQTRDRMGLLLACCHE